jgi:lipopolysaccharide assembly protein A
VPQQLTVFLALAFSIVIALFAVQNTTPVAVQFLTLRADAVAVSVLVLISAALGAAAMLLLGLAREVGLRWRHRAVAQQLKTAQARVAALEATQAEAPPAGTSTPALSSTTTVPITTEQPESQTP